MGDCLGERVPWLTRRQALLGMAGVLVGCNQSSRPSGRSANPRGLRPPERRIGPATHPWYGIEVPRTVLSCPAGDCILLHVPVRKEYQPDAMIDLLAGNPETAEDDGEIVGDAGQGWAITSPSQLCQFNCCAYAVGDVIGLGPTDWLCGDVNPTTDATNPMQVVLDSYYERVAEFDPPFASSAISAFAASPLLRDDDVVCLAGSRGPEYPHAARVRRRQDRNWVVGKFGEDPILWTPLETVGREFESQFDRVWVFRVRSGRRSAAATP